MVELSLKVGLRLIWINFQLQACVHVKFDDFKFKFRLELENQIKISRNRAPLTITAHVNACIISAWPTKHASFPTLSSRSKYVAGPSRSWLIGGGYNERDGLAVATHYIFSHNSRCRLQRRNNLHKLWIYRDIYTRISCSHVGEATMVM
jgi:hypothetical protein